ncbi:MAG: hypothetical protein R2867_35720 [Caldilineaceae bacterium]
MTTQSVRQPIDAKKSTVPRATEQNAAYSIFAVWRSNFELLLAATTLIALLIGWIGGSLTGWLPGWTVAAIAVLAYVAGGYAGMTGAIAEAREGKLDIDFLMIAAALGAAAIGEWEEGALLLFLHLERCARGICHGTHSQGHRIIGRFATRRSSNSAGWAGKYGECQ